MICQIIIFSHVRCMPLCLMPVLLCRRVFKDTGRLLLAFLIGSVATVAGTLVAFKALPLRDMGADGWKVWLSLLIIQP